MEQIILFAFLAVFPFGQIVRIGILHPMDVIVGVGAIYAIVKNLPKPKVFGYLQNFLLIALFSWIFSIFIFWKIEVLYGFLYLIRLAAYFYFFVFVYNFKDKAILLNSLMSLSFVSAIFGWVQYFSFPALKPFMIWGWDEHLYRIVGTFLDSSFISLILVFGIIISLFQKKILLALFLVLTLAFTYSRAGYLSFFMSLIAIWSYIVKTRMISILALIMLVFIIFLPRPEGEGVKLERINSILARITNYRETLNVFKTSPVFGIGYNNLCVARQKYIAPESLSSHSCSGSDSSLLFILSTTGIVGFLYFVYLVHGVWREAEPIFKVSALALLTHSFFTNSLFYPWIMGWMIVLLAISLRCKAKG